MAGKARIFAWCKKCGPFVVIRRRRLARRDGCPDSDLPQNVVCPQCRQWGTITRVEEA